MHFHRASHSSSAILRPDGAFYDAARKFWSLYVLKAEKVDKELVESWKGDTDGILIFVRVLSSYVLTLTYLERAL